MTLTLTHYDTTITVSQTRDDLTADEFASLCQTLMLAAGYHPENVREAFGLEEASDVGTT